VYRTRIEHVRRRPWRRRFRLRSWWWVVDLDALPAYAGRLGPLKRHLLGSVEARDHLGDPGGTLRGNLERFLGLHGIDLGDARVRLGTQPRALGHCFNPISVFWCTRRDGTPLATVVEVHNTYGDRHAYLLPAGGSGTVRPQATVPKRMYVSPFHGVDGTYRVAAPEPDARLDLAVSLRTEDGALFSAWVAGERVAHAGTGVRLRSCLVGVRDSLLIRLHGIALLLRGLRVQPRPDHHQEGVR
jgi:DUF1365 family protein